MRNIIPASITMAILILAFAARGEVAVDAAFPGGNVIVDRIDGGTVRLHQDLRDTDGDWFYWSFRARGAASRTLRFEFTGSDVIGTRGPAVSVDAGATWAWLGRAAVQGKAFSFTFPVGADDVRFSMTIPYLQEHLRAFLGRNPQVRSSTLCRTAKGREVELLRFGHTDGEAQHVVLLTARHHACEAMASYVLEGIALAVLADDEPGRWLRANVEFLVVPFVDKDGVEDGDQGKNRRPHDHNRDYEGQSLYPAVAAIKDLASAEPKRPIRAALDVHCPMIRGGRNERIFFVLGPDPLRGTERVQRFSRLLESMQSGPLVYRVQDNIAAGVEWNTIPGLRSFSHWMAAQPNVTWSASLEVPYANVAEQSVTPESARALGEDVARAIERYVRKGDF